jgi:hypothetical protein
MIVYILIYVLCSCKSVCTQSLCLLFVIVSLSTIAIVIMYHLVPTPVLIWRVARFKGMTAFIKPPLFIWGLRERLLRREGCRNRKPRRRTGVSHRRVSSTAPQPTSKLIHIIRGGGLPCPTVLVRSLTLGGDLQPPSPSTDSYSILE